MNEDWQLESRGCLPDWVEIRIVEREWSYRTLSSQ
jgi:hypothetical protein